MFGQPNAEGSRKQRGLTAASVALHALLLAWLVHTPAPLLLTASSVTLGRNGNSATRVYWPTPTPDDSKASSPMTATQVYRRQRLGHEKLIWKNTFHYPKLPLPPTSLSQSGVEDQAKAATLSNLPWLTVRSFLWHAESRTGIRGRNPHRLAGCNGRPGGLPVGAARLRG
jgi:hypothetical protein